MKRLFLYIILTSYTALMLKPVLPYVKDGIEHIFFFAQHMATVHYENGNYHVHYETAKSTKEENSNNPSPNSSSRKGDSNSEQVLTVSLSHEVNISICIAEYHAAAVPALLHPIKDIYYPPPRF
jgi:hypothetical protein